MPNATFTKEDCIRWKQANTTEANIIRDILQRWPDLVSKRITPSDDYPWVFGPIGNTGEYGIIHKNFSSGHFQDHQFNSAVFLSSGTTLDITSSIIIKFICLSHDECLLLQFYCGIRVHDPRSHLVLPYVFGLVFTLLVPITTKESFKKNDVMLAFTAIQATIMLVYPFLVRLEYYARGAVVQFNHRQLLIWSFRMATLLCIVLGFFPIAQEYIKTDNKYLTSASIGASTGAVMATLNNAIGIISNEFSLQKINRPTIEKAVTPYLAAMCTFSSQLSFQTLVMKYIFSEKKIQDYNPAESLELALLMSTTLWLLETSFGFIFSKLLHWMLDDSNKISEEEEREFLIESPRRGREQGDFDNSYP